MEQASHPWLLNKTLTPMQDLSSSTFTHSLTMEDGNSLFIACKSYKYVICVFAQFGWHDGIYSLREEKGRLIGVNLGH